MDKLNDLFRIPCPTSSAMRAQIWFELRYRGLRVLGFALAMAVGIYFIFEMGIRFAAFRPFAMISVMGCVPAAMLIFGRNAFGIQGGDKRANLSAFEATQPWATARLAGVKLLVRSACVLVAMAIIGTSVLASLSLVNEWGTWTSSSGKTNLAQSLLQTRIDLVQSFFGATGSELLKNWVASIIRGGLIIAALATISAVRARYPRRLLVAFSLLAVLIGLSIRRDSLPDAIDSAMPWVILAVLAITAINVLRSAITERALTMGYLVGAVLISAVYFAAIMRERDVESMLARLLLPFLVLILAPWSLSRVRHT